MNATVLRSSDTNYPLRLRERLGEQAPQTLTAVGNIGLLSQPKVALFCSAGCPGDAVPDAYDAARTLRKKGLTVISGFHSPVEKECLRILLEEKQPVIICLARMLGKLRIPAEWRPALEDGRLLILSRFERSPRRADTSSARRRNELVAALADEVLIIYATPGGQIERISRLADSWRLPRRQLDSM